MSILQEYEEIRKQMSKRKYDNINKFLENHPQFLLSDVYYRPEIYHEFEKWQNNYEQIHLSYFYVGLSQNPFMQLSLDELLKELEENPPLKEHVLAYAKENLEENSLSDKSNVVLALETLNVDILYNCDTEVRENFYEAFRGGLKTRLVELNSESKKFQKEKHRDESR